MYDLLAALIVPDPLSGFLARILAAFPEHMSNHALEPSPVDRPPSLNVNASSRRPVERMIEPLTPRETQVVRLLCEPLGIKEIARMLDVSYATAKRHSINIYGKLGVNSRWDAVKKAKDLGIIPQLDRDLH
jgi:ATP/maltotriose-dependent transcriptional regulator MalT